MKELNGLTKLRGTLKIKGLRHRKEFASKSKDSNMKEKIHLQDLTLSWIEEDVDESNIGYNEESREALLPHDVNICHRWINFILSKLSIFADTANFGISHLIEKMRKGNG
ncbi:hypothetical protein ACB092_11G240100 [Castanea dentata]